MKQLYGLLLYPYLTMAQSPAVKPLSIGDTVPDITFTQMVNSKSQITKLSGFKGKLIILDFWATWCGNCIDKFNLLDSVQRTYPDQLQVILINTADTRDTKERIERFLNRRRNAAGQKFSMPVVYNDTVTGALFPHETIPHYVWLSTDLQFIAATGAAQVTAANIQKLLNGQVVQFAGYKENTSFDFTKPFFAGTPGPAKIQFRSTLTGFAPGIAPGSKFIKDSASSRFTIINMPLRELLKTAYSLSFQQDRLLTELSDSLQPMLTAPADQVQDSNRYCYEFIGPPMRLKQLLIYMQQDIQRYLGLAIKMEIRPASCYIINIDSSRLYGYKTGGGKPANKLFDRDKRTMVNKPLATLVTWLDKTLGLPVILKTSPGFNLDLELPDTPAGDIGALQVQLARMGILLTASTELTEQHIIYQTPKQKLP